MSQPTQTRLQLLDQLVELAEKLRHLEAGYAKSLEGQLALEEHEELFQTVFRKAHEGIAVIREGIIVLANPRVCDIIGASPQELIGSDFQQYVRSDLVPEALRRYEDHLAGKSVSMANGETLVNKDGSEVNVECIAAKIAFEGQDAILFMITDVTYIRKAEEELVRLRQYQVSLVEHANILVVVSDESGKVAIWNKAAEEITGYQKEDVIGHARIWAYLFPDQSRRDEALAQARSVIEQGEAVRGYETEIVTRPGNKKVISWYSRNLKSDAGHRIGSIAIGIDVTAARAANEALSRANQALSLAYDQTIEGWSRALDLRDKETEGHSLRVAEMTVELGRLAGMSEAELVDVRRGALLHDIGKLGVPDSILLKPDKLSDEEWVGIRKHPEYAYSLLSPIEYLHAALDIPFGHHERWDGKGYPRGLKGEQIPFAARLFAVVDTYDAMTSDRPYRTALTPEQATAYIISAAGTHFDPQAVKYFLMYRQSA